MAEFKEQLYRLIPQDYDDNEKYIDVTLKCIRQSEMISVMFEDEDDTEIPLPNLKYDVLAKIVEYMRNHEEVKTNTIPKPLNTDTLENIVSDWDYSYITGMENTMLFEVMEGANYLDIGPLLEMCCAHTAVLIKNKSVEEIRELFNITDDFTEEDRNKIKNELEWFNDE